ncbi:MAG TPA: hypothetical protein VF491_07070 [Vicinamibacterales bacterium]
MGIAPDRFDFSSFDVVGSSAAFVRSIAIAKADKHFTVHGFSAVDENGPLSTSALP